MKEKGQTKNRQQLKKDDTENRKIETSTQKSKPKEMTLEKTDERERNNGETKPLNLTKPQNITEDGEKKICMGCNKYVETSVQCGSCYR